MEVMGTFGDGDRAAGIGCGWGHRRWGQGGDGEKNHEDGWDGDHLLSPCSCVIYMIKPCQSVELALLQYSFC